MLMLLVVMVDQSLDAPLPMDGPPMLDMISVVPGFPRDAFLASPNKALRLAITVDPKGKVRRCDIVESSGTEAVDKKICGIAKSYAMFPAPIGADGKATYGRFEGAVDAHVAGTEEPPAARHAVPI